MIARVQKWGNSQGLRVAKPLLEAAHLNVGSEVEIVAKEGQLIVRAVKKAKVKIRIENLVAQMPKNYKPQEEGFGPAQGKEAW
jgi:antitoxin MazE